MAFVTLNGMIAVYRWPVWADFERLHGLPAGAIAWVSGTSKVPVVLTAKQRRIAKRLVK